MAEVAELKLLLPDWEAVIVVVPTPIIVTVFPETVATSVLELE